MGQTVISGHCYGKNGEGYVVDFACVKCRRIGILRTCPICVGKLWPALVYMWRGCLWCITDALPRRADHGSGQGDNDNLTLLAPELFRIHALAGARFQGNERNIL
jgi:hypothetical protein